MLLVSEFILNVIEQKTSNKHQNMNGSVFAMATNRYTFFIIIKHSSEWE